MIEKSVVGRTLPDTYHEALKVLHEFGESVPCPDYNTEQIEIGMTMVVQNPLSEPMISRCGIFGTYELQQYVMEMLDGILDFEVDYGKWEYTYHRRYGYQVEAVIDELRRNPYTRRAVLTIRKSVDICMDDPPCLQHIQYFIRNGALDCDVLFRSNDAVKATFMNAFALIMLQKRMADTLGIDVGTYTHRANSFHCYKKDIPLLQHYVRRINDESDITYSYIDGWKEDMDECIPEIMESVEILKNRK